MVTSAVLIAGIGTATTINANQSQPVNAAAEKIGGIAQQNDWVSIIKPNIDINAQNPYEDRTSLSRLGGIVNNTSNLMYQTFHVYYVDNIAGDYYYELWSNQSNSVIGIVPATAATKISNSDGLPVKSDFYVRVTDQYSHTTYNIGGYDYKNDLSTMYNKIYHVKTMYHTDLSTYYSLYNSNNTWMGYLPEYRADKVTKLQGVAHSTKQYVSLKSKNYTIWNGFDFKTVRHYSKNYYQKTYLVKTYYNHYNGNRYDSLYDSKGKWFGYINAAGVSVGKGAQGAAVSANKRVTVKSKNYYTYSNFNWKKKSKSSSLYNKKYTVKTIYHHANGSVYYSLFSGSKWMGYINAKAVH